VWSGQNFANTVSSLQIGLPNSLPNVKGENSNNKDGAIYMYLTNAFYTNMVFENSKLDKKENQIFIIYKEFQNRAVAKSYMTNGLLKYG
jgi:hypothetical protein